MHSSLKFIPPNLWPNILLTELFNSIKKLQIMLIAIILFGAGKMIYLYFNLDIKK
jgi:hypothetical protein